MTRIEVVTHDLATGSTEVDHVWSVQPDSDEAALLVEAGKWADQAAAEDHSTDHVVYVRGV